jgi:hypothetical protein
MKRIKPWLHSHIESCGRENVRGREEHARLVHEQNLQPAVASSWSPAGQQPTFFDSSVATWLAGLALVLLVLALAGRPWWLL